MTTKTKKTLQDYMTAFNVLGYKFRTNELDDTIEVNDELISDLMESKIVMEMMDRGFGSRGRVVDAIKTAALANKYNPVKDYLHSTRYDGGDHIANLTSHFVDKHGVFDEWMKKWLIGSVAKVFGQAQNPMLVLDGKQNIGKSFFARWLAPKELRRKHFIEEPINPEDKDTQVRLAKTWIWEVSELQSTTRRADREALKAIITKDGITVRKSYGHHDIHKPALASFIGTVNNDTGILHDPTGSRRFLIAHIQDIDWSYASKINVDDIWAEAYASFLIGDDWDLSAEQVKRREEINEEYAIPDPAEELIKEHFIIDPGNKNIWTSSMDILERLTQHGLTGNQRMNLMHISAVMTKYGCERARKFNSTDKKQLNGYYGVEPIANQTGQVGQAYWDDP